MSLALKPVVSRRPFVTSPYITGEDGRLSPTRPLRCPVAFDRGGTCTLYIERWRWRAHGPGFLLCCLRCIDDGISFTVYPPGWVPYGREAIMAFDHRGRIVAPAASGSRWEDTAFTAVVDAAAGKLWADVLVLGPSIAAVDDAEEPKCRKTQRRHMAGAMRLFALDAAGTTHERDLVGRATGVDLTFLSAAAHRIRAGPSLKARGCEGAKVLEQLPAIIGTFSGLLALGHTRGFWGPALS